MHGSAKSGLALFILGLFISLTAAQGLSPAVVAAGTSGPTIIQLTKTKYSNCFFSPPSTGNPLFGDPQAWGNGTAWAPCASMTAGTTPSNFTYSFLNYTTGKIQARTLTQDKSGIPAGKNLGLWYYRGQVVVYYSANATFNLYSYDTSGFSTATGNKYTVKAPWTSQGAGKLAFSPPFNFGPSVVPAFTQYDAPSPGISGTHPTIDGSSAVVAIAYQLQVPNQTITDSSGAVLDEFPAQYSVELVKFSNGQWTPYEPTIGPSSSEYSVVTLTCHYTDESGAPASYQYQALEQTKAPVAVISGGYAGFTYVTADYSVVENSCELPDHFQTNLDLNVGDLNVGNVAHTIESFSPPTPGGGETPEGVTTCSEDPPCFGSFVGMWGNLLIYKLGDGTLRLLDTLRPPGGNNDFKVSMDATFPAGAFPGKTTDGASMFWYTTPYWQTNATASVQLWNGHLGIYEILANKTVVDQTSFPKTWVDGRWAVWINGSGADYTYNFYDVYNNTVAYLKHPIVYRESAPKVVVGGVFSALADFQRGMATWVSNDQFVNSSGFLLNSFNLHWYNVTLASEGKPASGELHLPWANAPDDLVTAGDWAYIIAPLNGTTTGQVFAVRLSAATGTPVTGSTTSVSASTGPTASTSSTGGGVPEFPAQFVPAALLAVLLVVSYLAARRTSPRGQPKD